MVDLTAAGLSKTEANCYQALVTKEDWQPSKLAEYVSESRTNMYKILDKLVLLGLAEKFNKAKKIHYRAANPSRLLQLAHETRAQQEAAQKELELGAQSLMREYIKTNEQPGVQYYQGQTEIRTIFEEIENSNSEVVFVHTLAGTDFYGFDEMHKLRIKAAKSGVPRRGLTPDTKLASYDYKEKDHLVKLTRTWLAADDYTAPVEWGAFDNKLYIISYGEEALGMIIESQQISDAFKQIYNLLERGQKLQPDYEHLPKLAQRKVRTD
ncbi:MAG: helix-turn-helix domain-containing protein [Candidatus Saccharimonadales bacterium]